MLTKKSENLGSTPVFPVRIWGTKSGHPPIPKISFSAKVSETSSRE